MRTLTANGNFDEAQLETAAVQQGALHAQLIVERARTKAAMFEVLTDVQKTQLAEFRQKAEQKKAERMSRRAERKAEKQ